MYPKYRRKVSKHNLKFRIKLDIAIKELDAKEKLEKLVFWGKIRGEESDYYIAVGYNYTGHYEFPEKRFFFAPQNFKFEPLPETFDYHDQDFRKHYYTPLKGNPELIIKKYKEEKEEEEGEGDAAQEQQGEDDEENKPADPDASVDDNAPKKEEPKENFTEKLKLSYLVRQIDYDTSIIPEGAWKLTPDHELRPNKTFKGLKKEDLKDKRKFLHFRPITDQKKKEYVETDEAIFKDDILESIADDKFKGCWSIQLDPTKTICNVRNLLWPGYYAVHKSNSGVYCSAYFGNGFKNSELPFMI